MKKIASKIVEISAQFLSIIGHPIFWPLYVSALYFDITNRYFLPQNKSFFLYYLFIVAIFIPLLFLAVLFYTKTLSGYQLNKPKERLLFSGIMAVVYFLIFKKLSRFHQFIELYPFFLGIFLAILSLAVYNYFNRKPSIHAMALGGSLSFLLIWSYYTQIDILNILIGLIITSVFILAARLYLKAHNFKEIAGGFFIGCLMQLVAFYIIWLYY